MLSTIRDWADAAIARVYGCEWHPYPTPISKRLIDGSVGDGYLMRRRVNRKWQYRLPTDDEADDVFFDQHRGL